MRIGPRILSGYLIVVLFTGVIGFLSIRMIRAIERQYDMVAEETIPILRVLEDLRFAGLRILSATNDCVFGYGQADRNRATRDRENACIILETGMRKYRYFTGESGRDKDPLVVDIVARADAILKGTERVMRLHGSGFQNEALFAEWARFVEDEKRFQEAVRKAIKSETNEFIDRKEEVSRTISRTVRSLLALHLVMLLGAVAAATVARASIVSPIVRLKNAAARIGRGEFDTPIDIHSSDEVGELAATFRKTAADLAESRHDLLTSKERTENILQSLSDMLLVVSPDGTILRTNEATCAITGYAAQDLAGQPYPVLIPDASLPLGEVRNVERVYRARDGRAIPVMFSASALHDPAGVLEGYVCVARDITERKKVELALAEEKERLAVTLRSIGESVIAVDTAGTVLLMNDTGAGMTGWPTEEAVGKPLAEVFRAVDEKSHQERSGFVESLLASGTPADEEMRCILVSRDGTERIVAGSAALIRDAAGRAVGVVLVFRDITDKAKMEDELLKARKLESLGILAGGIAHDFNNFLAAIVGNLSLAKLSVPREERIFHRLDEAEKASLRAKDLACKLLTFSKGGAPIKSLAAVQEIVRDSTLFALRGSNVRCEFDLPDSLWAVEVDEGQMSQVVNNLVINAVQAMPAGGVLHIRGENVTMAEGEIPNVRPGIYVRLEVRDQGPGIPKEILGKIFDPYFTTKPEGSGLGLTTTYNILKSHGGNIFADSTPGEGTTFRIYLPSTSLKAPVRKPVHEVPIFGKGRVLIMDDEALLLEVAGEMLRHIGYEASFARNGEETIDLYSRAMEAGRPFSAVLMDLTIPGGMGGQETIRRLLEIDPDVRAIVSSGYSNNPIMAEYRRYGFRGVVAKPYKIETFSRVLHEVITDGAPHPA